MSDFSLVTESIEVYLSVHHLIVQSVLSRQITFILGTDIAQEFETVSTFKFMKQNSLHHLKI